MKKAIRGMGRVLATWLCSWPLMMPLLAQEFDPPFDIRERLGLSRDTPFSLAVSGRDIYTSWVTADLRTREWTLNFAHSPDAGLSFQVEALEFSRYQDIYTPLLVENNGTVYLVHTQGPCAERDLYFCRVRDSGDSACRRLLGWGTIGLADVHLAVAGHKVYIVWRDGAIRFDVYLIYSTDDGETFSEPINLTNAPAASPRTVTGLMATGNEVYVRWNVDRQAFLIHGTVTETGIKIPGK